MKRVAAIVPILFVLIPQTAHAELLRACTETGNCGVCDIVATAVTIGKWLITGSAALALVVIVWASIGFATSAGNPDKIGVAKKQILGAVLGVGIVFAAFYLVFWVILAFANPTQQFRFSEAPETGEKVARSTGLVDFLGGTAWWNLCNEADLRKNSDSPGSVKNETADCKYWGDNTSCSENSNKVCCSGTCQNAPCVPNPGVAAYIGTRAAAPAPGPAVCSLSYDNAEQVGRDRTKAISGISINNGGFTGKWCGQSRYQDYRATCGGGCTNVGGLKGRIFGYLETIKNECGNFTISGGSELGHSSTGGHSQGSAVDFKPVGTSYGAFLSCLKGFTLPASPVPIQAICTIAGHEPYNCDDYHETENHIHVTFN